MTSERETRFSRKPTSENNRSRARKSQSNFARKLFSRYSKEKFWLEKCDFSLLFRCFEIFETSPGKFFIFFLAVDCRGLPWIGGVWRGGWLRFLGKGSVFFSIGFILRWGGGRRRVFWRRGFCRRACGQVRRCVVWFLGGGLGCGCGCFGWFWRLGGGGWRWRLRGRGG